MILGSLTNIIKGSSCWGDFIKDGPRNYTLRILGTFTQIISVWFWKFYLRDIFRVVPQWGHNIGGHIQLSEVAWTWSIVR